MGTKIVYALVLLFVYDAHAQTEGCHCVNVPVAEVRESECGDVYKEHTYGACWFVTGEESTCIVGGTEVDVIQVDYGNGRLYWIERNALVSASSNCTLYTGTCNEVTFVTREEWGAREPRQTTNITTPFSMVIVHHTAGTHCYSQEQCVEVVQGIQDFHMDTNGWDDIGYNFLVGEDGRVYEGRGWINRGAHAREHNDYSHGISIMGDFMERYPWQIAIDAVNNLIACGVDQGYITPGHEVFGHRDGVCTLCPGDQLYELLQTWPTFSTREIPIYC